MAPPHGGSFGDGTAGHGSATAWGIEHFAIGIAQRPTEVSLALPAAAEPAFAPALDVGAAPGAEVALLERWTLGGSSSAELGCIIGPADRWVDGLQDAVLAAASAMARARGGWSSLSPEAAVHEPDQSSQLFSARGEGRSEQALGRHWLGFVGDAPKLCVCTVVCAEPPGDGPMCRTLVESLTLQGAVSAPPPTLTAQAFRLASAAPELTLALGCAFAVALAALALRYRPRPRP